MHDVVSATPDYGSTGWISSEMSNHAEDKRAKHKDLVIGNVGFVDSRLCA